MFKLLGGYVDIFGQNCGVDWFFDVFFYYLDDFVQFGVMYVDMCWY